MFRIISMHYFNLKMNEIDFKWQKFRENIGSVLWWYTITKDFILNSC